MGEVETFFTDGNWTLATKVFNKAATEYIPIFLTSFHS